MKLISGVKPVASSTPSGHWTGESHRNECGVVGFQVKVRSNTNNQLGCCRLITVGDHRQTFNPVRSDLSSLFVHRPRRREVAGGVIIYSSRCLALNKSTARSPTIMCRGNPMQITLRYPIVTCPGCKRPMRPAPPLPVSVDTDLCDVHYTCEDCGAITTRTIKIEK
jgi:hypothetical protein